MIDQLLLQSAEPNYVPYVLIVSMGLAVIAMAIVTLWPHSLSRRVCPQAQAGLQSFRNMRRFERGARRRGPCD
jgi:hypothetical protein